MKSLEAIRLNITIHPDKDPALFKFIASVSKESRTRRLIGLAAIGFFAEYSAATRYLPSGELKESDTLDTNQPVAMNGVGTKLQSNQPTESNGIVHEEGELEAIGGFFA